MIGTWGIGEDVSGVGHFYVEKSAAQGESSMRQKVRNITQTKKADEIPLSCFAHPNENEY